VGEVDELTVVDLFSTTREPLVELGGRILGGVPGVTPIAADSPTVPSITSPTASSTVSRMYRRKNASSPG